MTAGLLLAAILAALTPLEEARRLLSADFAALNRGERTLVSVGDRAMALAAQTQDAALAAVLGKGAERLYDRACENLPLGSCGALSFAPCPTGTVDLVRHWRDGSTTRVAVTRRYWMLRFPLTRRQAAFYPPLTPAPQDAAGTALDGYVCPNRRQAEALCAYFTVRLRDRLPAGYEIRLPTLAEWERAYHADAGLDDPFCDLLRIHRNDDVHRTICYDAAPMPVPRGKRRNAWGIGDWCEQERVLDSFDLATLELAPGAKPGDQVQVSALPEPPSRENPVYSFGGKSRVTMIRMPFWARWAVAPTGLDRDWCPLRLVIAPPIQ